MVLSGKAVGVPTSWAGRPGTGRPVTGGFIKEARHENPGGSLPVPETPRPAGKPTGRSGSGGGQPARGESFGQAALECASRGCHMRLPHDHDPKDGPRWARPEVQKILRAMLVRRVANPSDQEELFQELWVHLWRVERERPGQSLSWYLQNCALYLNDRLKAGRSLDSPKRRSGQVPLPLDADDEAPPRPALAARDGDPRVHAQTRDLFAALWRGLNRVDRVILVQLAEERPLREIARALRLSSRDVVARRQGIASMAQKLGLFTARGE